MRLPLELIVALAVAEICSAGFSTGRMGLLGSGITGNLTILLATLLAVGLICAAGSWWTARRLHHRRADRLAIAEIHERLMASEYVMVTAAYAAFCTVTAWPAWVIRPDGLDAAFLPVASDLLQIAPFILMCLVMWVSNYPACRATGPAHWSLIEYLRAHARGMFLLLGPWMLLCAARGLWPHLPVQLRESVDKSSLLTLALTGAAVLGMVAVFPFYVLHLWPHARLPDGPLRKRLEALLLRSGVRCRDMMVWKTGRGRLPNAAVMGLLAWSRYIVFTDALLEELSEAEIEAVLAHEIGHVRHRHIACYLLFAVVYMLALAAALSLLPEPLRSDVWVSGVVSILLLIFCLRAVFGLLSRRLERQADLAAADLIGSPLPLMGALERLADSSGASRTASNWRHHSVAERVAFLSRFGFDADVRREHHAQVRMFLAMIAIMAALLAVVAWQYGQDSVLSGGEMTIRERQLLREIARNPHDYESHLALGRLLEEQGRGRESEAWEHYQRAADLNAFLPDGHIGLARLSLRDELWAPRRAVALAEEAVRRARDASRNHRSLVEALNVLAEAAYRAENPELAVSAMQEAVAASGGSPDCVTRLEFYRKAAERSRKTPPGTDVSGVPPDARLPRKVSE